MLNTHIKPLSKNYICKTPLETFLLFRTPLKTFFHLILKLDFDYHLNLHQRWMRRWRSGTRRGERGRGEWEWPQCTFIEREIELLELQVWHLRHGMVWWWWRVEFEGFMELWWMRLVVGGGTHLYQFVSYDGEWMTCSWLG